MWNRIKPGGKKKSNELADKDGMVVVDLNEASSSQKSINQGVTTPTTQSPKQQRNSQKLSPTPSTSDYQAIQPVGSKQSLQSQQSGSSMKSQSQRNSISLVADKDLLTNVTVQKKLGGGNFGGILKRKTK